MEATKRKLKPKVKGIYVLSCPDTGEVRYIGQTKNAAKRYTAHKCSRGFGAKDRWVESLKSEGKTPKMTMAIHTDDLDAEEIELISIYRAMGANLLNVADGGKDLRWAVGENSAPWLGKNKMYPSRYYLMRWKEASRHDPERYKRLSAPVKAWLKSLSAENRFRAEIRFAETMMNSSNAPSFKGWFSEVKDKAIKMLPEVRAEIGGL